VRKHVSLEATSDLVLPTMDSTVIQELISANLQQRTQVSIR